MINIRTILLAIVVIASITMVSCKDNKPVKKAETTNEKQEKDYTSAYACHMHYEDIGGDKVGKYSNCGMTLVKNEDHIANAYKHK